MKVLLKLMDVKTLIAGIIPVVLGSVYSLYRFGKVGIMDIFIISFGMVLIQSCANMVNDLFDHQRGNDGEEKSHEKALASGEVTRKGVIKIVIIFLVLDLLIATYYSIKIHWAIMVVSIVSALIIYFYSAGDRPISHTPFGEFVAGTTMGFGIMTTVIYIQSGVFDLETVIVALPTAIYIGTILLTNNISDHHEDRKAGRLTLPIHIGIHWAELLWVISCHSLLTFTAAFVLVGYYPLPTLVIALAFFPYKQIYDFKKVPKEAGSKDYLMGLIGKIGIRYHLSVIVGILVTLWI